MRPSGATTRSTKLRPALKVEEDRIEVEKVKLALEAKKLELESRKAQNLQETVRCTLSTSNPRTVRTAANCTTFLFYFSDANYDANKCFRRAGKKHMAQPKD